MKLTNQYFYVILILVFLVIVSFLQYTDYFVYHPALITTLSALLVPAIAIFGVFIGYRQTKIADAQRHIAKTKLRLELFEKRFAIYDATRTFMSSMLQHDAVTTEDMYAYVPKIQGAKWLLNDDIDNYLKKIVFNKALEIQAFDEQLKGMPRGEKRTAIVQARMKTIAWVYEQFAILEDKFSPYMKFRIK